MQTRFIRLPHLVAYLEGLVGCFAFKLLSYGLAVLGRNSRTRRACPAENSSHVHLKQSMQLSQQVVQVMHAVHLA